MDKERPVSLSLRSFKFPLTARLSILHRVSGFLMLFIVAFLLLVLDHSLSNEENFNEVMRWLSLPWNKAAMWLFLAIFLYHLIAGIRHLVMDFGIAEGKVSGVVSTVVVWVIYGIAMVLLGGWII